MCPFLHEGADSFVVELFEFPVDSRYYFLMGWIDGKDFLSFSGLSLESSDCFFCGAEAL
jgi:hypothetical protein